MERVTILFTGESPSWLRHWVLIPTLEGSNPSSPSKSNGTLNMNPIKFELTPNTKTVANKTLHQIRSLITFTNGPATIEKGELGGWVESIDNLAQTGNCWISENACVYDSAYVYGDAIIYGNVHIFDCARVYGNAMIYGNAKVYDTATVHDHAHVHDNVNIYGNANVRRHATLHHNAHVYDNAKISGYSKISHNAKIYEYATVNGQSTIQGNSQVHGYARIEGGCLDHEANVFEHHLISFGTCNTDLSDLKESIKHQTGLAICNDEIYCYKLVRKYSLASLFDPTFIYKVGEIATAMYPDMSNKSCASGLHFSHATYYNNNENDNTSLLLCRVKLADIITCQEGKIRAKRCFVIGICN